jgi:phage gp46-like protein
VTDVFLFQTLDDGDVFLKDGDLVMDAGLRTAAYLSLFGGNVDDDGLSASNLQFWANFSEKDVELMYRSRLQNLMQDIPLIPANLLRLEDAAKSDLHWLIDGKEADTIEVEASIPTVNTIKLVIDIDDVKLIFVETIDG